MKVAIIHDWLITYAGAERALEQIIEIYPDCDLFSIIDYLPSNQRRFIKNKKVETSFIQKLPFAKKHYRKYLSLMPLAIEQFDLSKYDLIISSSHAVAKGVITGPDQLHICYCYTPIRYAWDLQHQYLKEANLHKGILGWIARRILHKIRLWDYRTSNGVDHFIAISNFISKRIKKVYRRRSTVLFCPVDIDSFQFSNIEREDYYVTCSRMVPYKRIDLIVETFSKLLPTKKLIVIGDGPEYEKIRKLAGNNVHLMGAQPFEVLKKHLSTAKAFIFAAEEDFGIAPIEAQACGTPVIAYGKGGALETIKDIDKDKPSGIFFQEQTPQSLYESIIKFEDINIITKEACRKNAERFSNREFRNQFSEIVNKLVHEFDNS
tara:strand:+ start:489 stop:1619 length:1131 start_codon:yes stop_codon:yes gene_type:complete